MAAHTLSQGAVQLLHENELGAQQARFQVIDVKTLGAGQERVRVILSDGQYFIQGLLAPGLNELVKSNKLQPFAIVEIRKYLLNTVKHDQQRTMKIVIIMELQVVDPGPGCKIGNPQSVEAASLASQQQQPMQPQQQQQAFGGVSAKYEPRTPQHAGFGGAASGMPNTPIHPISALNPYQSKWTIKARVTARGDVRTWTNDRGQGKLFSVDLLDESGGEIRATMFNEACDKFYPLLQQNKVFLISNGHVKPANKRFSRLNCDYEITLNQDAEIRLVGEDSSIKQQRFDFVDIDTISQNSPQTMEYLDVIGVVRSVGEAINFTSKSSGKQLTKRIVSVADQSQKQIDLTLWGQDAEAYSQDKLPPGTILAVKTARLGEFQGGLSLNLTFGSQIFVNPERDEAYQKLKLWWDAEGSKAASFENISRGTGGSGGPRENQRMFLAQIKENNLGYQEKPDYFSCRATLTFFKEDMQRPPWYKACPSAEHNPKVAEVDHGYHCEKCNKTYDNFQARYILSLMACDPSGSSWLTAFDETATTILGKKADDLVPLVENNDEHAFKQVFAQACFQQYNLRIAVKAEPVNDEQRVRARIVGVEPVDYRAESRLLLEEIAKY